MLSSQLYQMPARRLGMWEGLCQHLCAQLLRTELEEEAGYLASFQRPP